MRRAFALGASLVIVVTLANPAGSQPGTLLGPGGGDVDTPMRPESSGECVGAHCFARVVVDNGVAAAVGASDPCTYLLGDHDDVVDHVHAHLLAEPGARINRPEPDPRLSERPWVVIYCPTSLLNGGHGLAALMQLGDPPAPAVIARVAERAIALPAPEASFSPAIDDFQVVGLDTWLWLDQLQIEPITATSCIQPADYACVDVTAVFDAVGADMGDGSDPLLCNGPGRPYDTMRSYRDQGSLAHCGHVYTSAPIDGSTYGVEVETTWNVSYSCRYDADLDGSHESSCGGGDLGLVARVSASQPFEVRDLQAIATQ